MPIVIRKVGSPAKRIQVDVIPPEWQTYIAH